MDAMGRGAALAGARDRMVMTQEALAAAAGISVPTVKRAEAGRPVQAETLRALCAVLGLDCRDLVGAEPTTSDGTPGIAVVKTSPMPAGRRGWMEFDATRISVATRGIRSAWNLTRDAVRRMGIVTSVLACIPVCFEACAWLAPHANTPVFFRYMQLHAIKSTIVLLLWVSVVDLWRDRGAWRTRSWLQGAFVACTLLAGDVGMVLGPLVWFEDDLQAMAIDMFRDMESYARYRKLVARMVADDPAYDRSVDDYNAFRHVIATGGIRETDWGTPGELKALWTERAKCLDDWKWAPVYDKARCDASHVRIAPFSRLGETVQAITGGPFNDRTVQDDVARYFADKRFDRARAEVAAAASSGNDADMSPAPQADAK